MMKFKSFSKEERFSDLCATVKQCNLCQRLLERNKILSDNNGNIYSKVLFIAEAPGRLGADRTGIPLFGDRTGNIFETLISTIGWKRDDIFLTNAILCNPRKKDGNNCTPTKDEINNCSYFLEMTIEAINPELIVPLGINALDALSIIHPHSIILKNHVAKLLHWNGRGVFPLYHPGPRALIHRNFIKQRSDYLLLAKAAAPLKGIKSKSLHWDNQVPLMKGASLSTLQKISLFFIRSLKEMSLFKLTKIMYLTDLLAINSLGKSLTYQVYLRQQEGPWLPDLSKQINKMDGDQVAIFFKKGKPFVKPGPNQISEIDLEEKSLKIIVEAINKYGSLSDSKIKTITYLTPPMKYILRRERRGENTTNMPIIYKDKTVIQFDTELP